MKRTTEAMREMAPRSPWEEPARLNQHGELEPIAVDESLTTLLFAAHQAKAAATSAPRPADHRVPSPAPAMPVRSTVALFEMV